jgi:glucose-6-phosphate-specific signal transduction histidine kinase
MKAKKTRRPTGYQAALRLLNSQLSRRTADLALSNQKLRQGISRRKGAESALKKSSEYHARLLKKSRELQKHLRLLARRILLAREDKRMAISRQLQDEIAQTLVGIKLQLMVLQREARSKKQGFHKEIATTQRLVGKSIGVMKRFDRANGGQHEA